MSGMRDPKISGAVILLVKKANLEHESCDDRKCPPYFLTSQCVNSLPVFVCIIFRTKQQKRENKIFFNQMFS